MIDEEFICDICNKKVPKLKYTARDHCPYCLHSKHVDINPGDRQNDCQGVLKPIDIEKFNDKSYELNILRWFRDNFVSIEDIQHYYEVAPIIVDAINREKHSNIIYDYIYDNIVDYCVKQILIGNYENAYIRYKSSALALEENFAKLSLINRFVKTLKNTKNN